MSRSGVGSGSVAPPAGGGFAAGLGEAFSLNLNTGQGSYSVPLDLPQGPGESGPRLKLEYVHGGRQGVVGHGWRLPMRAIERRLDFGTPPGPGELPVVERFHLGGDELVPTPDGTWRAAREATFARFERSGDGWILTEQNGERHELGLTAAGRSSDPDDATRVGAWLLERSVDASGNEVHYAWDRDQGTVALAEVRWSVFRLAFTYEARPDPLRQGRGGWLAVQARRLARIELFREDLARPLLRSWTLAYEVHPLTGGSLLASVRFVAHGASADGSEDVVRPPIRFAYEGTEASAPSIAWMEPEDGISEPPPLTDPDVALVTLDDLPLPGILQVVGGRHVYWPNRGEGRWGAPRPVRDAPGVAGLSSRGLHLIDLEGTGTADLYTGLGSAPTRGFYRNEGGSGWGVFVPTPRGSAEPPWTSGRVATTDLDGDGRMDVLYGSGRALIAWESQGEGGWSGPLAADRDTVPDIDLADPSVLMADMTGDGLADVVQIRSGRVDYWPNLGHGRFGARITMANSPRLPHLDGGMEQIVLIDADGTGCADLVRVSERGLEVATNQGGNGFADMRRIALVPAPIPGTLRGVHMGGGRAGGLLWNSRRARGLGYVTAELGAGPAPGRLRQVDNGLGLVSEISYGSAVDQALRDRDAGEPWSTHLPFPLAVVTTMREVDATSGRTTETRIRYHEGDFDSRSRRFLGFSRVEKEEVGDASRASVLSVHHFLARQAAVPGHGPEHAHLDGLLARLERFQLDGGPDEATPVYLEESEYAVSSLQAEGERPARAFVHLVRTRRTHTNRTADARMEERSYQYDADGNVVEEAFHASGTRQGAAVPEIRTTTSATYATDPSGRIRNALCQLVRRDSGGAIFEERRIYYDGPDFVGLPLGAVSAGHRTREERLVQHQAGFDAHYAGLVPVALGYTSGTDADGRAATFSQQVRRAFTPLGSVRAERDALDHGVSYVYDAAELARIERHEPLGVTRVTHDDRCLKPTRIEPPDGNLIDMRYDAQGRLLVVALGGDTLADPTRRYLWDDTAVPASQEVSYRIDATSRLRTRTWFDGRGESVQKRVERGPGDVICSGWIERNAWGQTRAEYEPTVEATFDFARPVLAGRPARRFAYDAEGRPIRTEDYGGGVSTAIYSPFDIEQRDANDNDASPENVARGQFDTPRRERLDAVNRRIALVEIDGGGAPRELRYQTRLDGAIEALDDALGRIATYTYDLAGNRLAVDHRDAGLRRLWYDATGRAVRTVDANGTDVRATYDALGRLETLSADGTLVEQYTYDHAATHGLGRLREVSYPGGSQRFAYNRRGQVTEHEYRVDGHASPHVLRFEYDGMGKQTAVVYPDGTRVEQHLSRNGMVQRIDGFVDEIDYDARNLPTRVLLANGVETTIGYAPGPGKVLRQRTVGPGGQLIQDASYTYDQASMIIGSDDQAPGGAQGVELAYDPLYQLTRARGQGASGAFDHAYGYTHGRTLQSIGEVGTTLDFGDAAHPDHITSIRRAGSPDFAPSYDANGNLTALPGRALTYDHKNQLVRVVRANGTTIDYGYDHRGKRVRKVVTEPGSVTETVMIGKHAEIRGGQVTRYVVLGSARIALERAGGTWWIHADPLGSATRFSDATGIGIGRIAYSPFGNVRSTAGSPAGQAFAGHQYDTDAELYFMGRRCYAPEIGRFLTPDPLYLYRPEDADGDSAPLSLYSYAGNDPTNRVDPAGLSFWSVFGAIIGVIVGIILAVVVIAAFICGVGWGLLAIAGVIGVIAAGYMGAREAAGTDGGEFLRGMLIGINAGMNFVFATLVFGLLFGPVAGLVIGITLGVINFLAAFDTIAQSEVYQGILGWTNWFMPMSWLVIGLGAVFWVLNVLGYLFTFGQVDALKIDEMRVDWKTGTIFTKGGWISNLNAWDTAFNMGNFAFVDTNYTEADWAMEHEAGHNLNLAAFGSIFHFVGFIDEMVVGHDAYSEQLAEGNDPNSPATVPKLPMWA